MSESEVKVQKLEQKLSHIEGSNKVDCLLELCISYMHMDSNKALTYSQEASQLAEEIEYTKGYNQAIYFYGLALSHQSEYKKAIGFLLDAKETKLIDPDKLLKGKVDNAIGNSFYHLGFLSAALPHYIQALKIFEELQFENGIAACITNIGIIHFSNKDYEKSLQFHIKAKVIQEKTGDQDKIDNLYNNIGFLYVKQAEYDKALEYFNLAQKSKNPKILALVCNNLSFLHNKSGNYEQALEYGLKSLKLRGKINDQNGMIATYSNIANIYLKLKKHQDALHYQLKSLLLAEEKGTKLFLKRNYQYLSEIYYALGDIDKVFEYQQKYFEINDQIHSEDKTRALAEMDIKYEMEKRMKESEIYRLKNVELKDTLSQLKKTQAQLIQTEKMASIGVLTAGIAHEINNPVNFISANVAPLKRNIEFLMELIDLYHSGRSAKEIQQFRTQIDFDYTCEETFGMINDILEGVHRTQEIVKGLQNFSRHDRDAKQTLDISECLSSTLLLLKTQIDRETIIHKNYTTLPRVTGFPGRINQVLMNILANAIHAVEANEPPKTKEITISTSHDKTHVQIQIEDNGIGMTDQVKSKIFDPFFTTKEVGKGTGLGLAISFNIIKEHKGSIQVESEHNKGTKFTISLPID